MTFRKYETDPAAWPALKAAIETTTEGPDGTPVTTWNTDLVVAVVELGHLCTAWGTDAEGMPVCEATSPKYAVDILWTAEPLASFDANVVWPDPCGVHVFAGWEAQYALDYCAANPDAAYCQPPTPPVDEVLA
jgi:hypothetical protein